MEQAKEILSKAIRRCLKTGKTLRIAIQKDGRLTAISLGLLRACFEACKIRFSEREKGELVTHAGNSQNIQILYVRSSDIPKWVKDLNADYGIVGEDQVVESKMEAFIASTLGVAQSRLCISVLEESSIRNVKDLAGKRVATSYPHLLRQYLDARGVEVKEIIVLSGSIEAAAVSPAVADAVCDIVETGLTLKTQGMRVVEEVRSFQAVLIGSSRHELPGSVTI